MPYALTLLVESHVLIAAIFITGIGGTFQFGFHMSVLPSPSPFIKELVNTTCVQRYNRSLELWEINLIWSFIISVLFIGGLMGSLSAGRLASAYGRKRCLLLNNLVAICGAVLMMLSKTAMSFEMIMAARFLYGINAGVGIVVHPMYLVECAPKRLQGFVGVSVVTFLSAGKFCGQLLGIRELLGTEDRWTWLLGFNGATALLQLATLPLLPESPRYLLLDRRDRQGCETAISRLWGSSRDHSGEVEEMLEEQAAVQGVQTHTVWELVLSRALRWQLLTVLVAFVTVQLCGANAVLLYSLQVFREAGVPTHELRHDALGTGLCDMAASMASAMVIESTGRKPLLYGGYLCMAATLALLTVTLYLQTIVSWMPYCSMVFVFLYCMFFSSGPAATTLPSVIFTQSFRSAGFTIGTVVNWFCLFLLGMLFPLIVEHLDYFCFLIFLFFCVLGGLFVLFNVPETKNRTVLEITAEFHRMHPQTGPSAEGSANGPGKGARA